VTVADSLQNGYVRNCPLFEEYLTYMSFGSGFLQCSKDISSEGGNIILIFLVKDTKRLKSENGRVCSRRSKICEDGT
jgi:hypothetical protein